MYLMQTVSAVPRPRTADTKPLYGERTKEKNGMVIHPRIIYDMVSRTDENEEKKKERKWTFGGFFKRKSKKDADDSSEESGGEENKKGFFPRRKSKRERRKTRSKANGFDVVVPQQKNGEISVEQLWSIEPNSPENNPVRYIHRHPDGRTNSLQVPKHRRDSRSSGGSENTEGRKGRKEVMARAEAKRDMMRDESSSDEYESYQSNSSLNRINGESRRPRRTKRSKDEDPQSDLRISKSDFEGTRRLPPNCRWISRTYYPDSSDLEPSKLNLMNHSGTPSPCRSPRARQKQLLHYMMMQNSYPTSTFPPGIHYQPSPMRNHYTKDVQLRNQPHRSNRNSEYNLPKCVRSLENNRKTLMDYEQFLNSCGSGKSSSYDQNIHRASYFESEVEVSKRANVPNGRPDGLKAYNEVLENRTDSLPSGNFPQPTQIVWRSASGNSFCERNFHPNLSNSYQQIPSYCPPQPKFPDSIPPKSHLNGTPSVLRYYADQNPRSRNPIHITCNPTTAEQPYLSDSQMIVKPVQPARITASDFWKLKDQEVMKQQMKSENTLKPPPQSNPRSRSSSPRMKKPDGNPRKMLKEEYNSAKVKTPPEPPVRRLSKQEVLARLQKCEQLKAQENEMNLKNETKPSNSNLDEALNELEMIYNSLSLKDEDLVDRAERRDLPVYRPKNPITSVSVRDKIQNFYAEADYSKTSDSIITNGHQRAIPLRRSGVPDKMTDDMAFRRLNQKDRTDVKKLPPQSYLRSSPALSPVQSASPTFRKDSPVLEPDITFDDVVFRNIRHANSTLKIQDPQPPFGIPIGVITPAPSSDYLHATPTERFRPTFISSKTPDVVKDDLAFRNLRKDNRTNTCLEPKNEIKKRAVRSLSANLCNIMLKDNTAFVSLETNNNIIIDKKCEKTQSLTDLTKGKNALEKRLKELKEEKNAKRAEFFELSQARKKSSENISWTDLANLNGDFSSPKTEDGPKKFKSPIVELSKYPAAAPAASLQGNPFKVTFFDDEHFENLLSALAKEAEKASKDLEKQLETLETKNNDKAIQEFDKKFKLDKTKRRRNLSLSSANDSKEEVRKTGSLERKKKMDKSYAFEEVICKTNACGERMRNQNFEPVTDLSQILLDGDHNQNETVQKDTNNVFQEVYEYNCNLEEREVVKDAPRTPDVEVEFEKLHEEVSTKESALDELIADVTSVDQSPSESYTSFPFPKDSGLPSGSGMLNRRDGTASGSGKAEGIPSDPNDSEKKKIPKTQVKMFPRQKEKLGVSASNSSSESDHKRERSEDARRRETSANCAPNHDPTAKSFKTTRKKEDLRGGGGGGGPFLRSYLNNQVPSIRRDGNKTDSASEDHGSGARGGASPTVIVRETKASRLRAASRTPTPDVGSLSPKIKKNEKEIFRPSFSGSPTFNSLNRKIVDKSLSRKSHLNRSHTSEGVYDDVYVPGGSNVRRRRSKNPPPEALPSKTTEKTRPAMGNTNGTPKDPLETSRTSPIVRNINRKSDKCSLTGSLPKKRPENLDLIKPAWRSPDKFKQIDIATRAEILAASTLKMINRLDEINNKSRRKSEVRALSILKNKPPATSPPGGDSLKPVSILKRKSLSQEEAQSYSPPVTFSPSVLKKETDPKRQGILKKRRSLDENEVMRRRSCSPETSFDFKSILKTQRRSSMEELTRSHSPDSTPQGILKRKSSKEEETEDEPQGILKRKSLPCLTCHHSKTGDAVGDASENVRPILKKKSSSEDHSTSDPSLSEVPKSILKKKTSVEADEPEDKPMKPILKTSRMSSVEETEDRRWSSNSFDEPKPILKRENGRSDIGVVMRVSSRHERPHSSSEIDSELSAIFVKRRSLEFQPVALMNFGGETKRSSSNDRLRGDPARRPLSVAEKIINLENFLEVERVERERRNSPPGTPPSNFERGRKPESQNVIASFSADTLPAESRTPDDKTDEDASSSVTVSSEQFHSSKSAECNDLGSNTCSNGKSQTSFGSWESGTDRKSDQLFKKTSSDLGKPTDENNQKYESDLCYSVDSCGVKISNLSLKDTAREEMDAEDLNLLQKSRSVSSKTSLFKEIENKFKADAHPVTKRVPTENTAINRRLERKSLQSNAHRHHTQPVSTEDVEQAVRKSKTTAEDNQNEGENHEDELCTMSYKDRLRLFESTFSAKLPEANLKGKRGLRHRTQPVTTDEVETAKNQRRPSSAREGQMEEYFSGVFIVQESDKSKPKGILKNLNDSRKSGSDSSDSERKSELNESFQNLKKVLRKETASELKGILKPKLNEKNTRSREDELVGSSKRDLAAILQKVEPVNRVRKPSGEASPRYMQNAGIARIINKTRNNSLLVKSQSHSSVSSAFSPFPEGPLTLNGESKPERGNGEVARSKDETDECPLSCSELRRSTTQPLGPSDEGPDDDMSGASIRERLARLKRSGELDWQKRKSHVSKVEDELSIITAGNYLFNERGLFRDKNPPSAPPISKESEELKNSSSILADRLGKLDAAKEGWKKRIKPSDAVRFSVEGKMLEKRESLSPPNATLQVSPTRTPLPERKKRSPKAARFRSKRCNPSLSSVPSSPSEKIDNPITRSVSAPGSAKDGIFGLSASDLKDANGPVVTVPRYDDETFTSFFEDVTTERLLKERLEIKDEDLDEVTRMKSSQLLVQKRNIKTQKRRATVKNPVKALAARLDLQEYTETKTGIAEKELKRLKIDKAAKHSTLAIEALAGLASQEDFTAVNLKKATEGGPPSPDAPYKQLMLLQVKGRRHVQTRLVEPVARNVNAGDCFVLVTPERVFYYVGEFANVIEKSRGAEISLHIQQKGDLGCSASSVITIGEGGRATKEQINEFWKLLGGEPGCERETGGVDEDELYESALVDTNMLYEMINDELVPVEAYWGSIPRIEVLDPNKILVFDFGSEFYVWNGKNVNLTKRKVALKLAKELWEEGFDYSECELCPLTAASHLGGANPWSNVPESEKAGPARPSWALFAKITQNMETVLFREKFLDWPDYTRVIRRGKNGEDEQVDPSGTSDVKPCDAKKMLENVVPEPDLILEGHHLGRGVRHFDEETRRCSEISTHGVTVWHVNEYEYSELPESSFGQFHTEDSYVVRWHYVITITGRELSGQPSKHLTTGRNRYAYFFWQGRESPINDKGAAACLTVELDKEHGPQVRVVEGFEPPAFLNLFRGGMVVHKKRRCSDVPRDRLRLFISRGEIQTEAVLFEVPCSMRQLRSLASFVFVNNETGKVIVWHGWKSPENNRKNAVSAAKRLTFQIPEFEFKAKEITIREEFEGTESQEFIKALGGDNRQLYYSLLQDKTELRTPRLFHLTSVSGEFLFNEIASPHLRKDSTTALPFLQSDLYSASQPALFLLDSSYGLWLWQGWWEDSEIERGTGYVRYQAERRAAMTTAITYWSLKYGSSPKAYLIWAGLEPLVFTNQFPFWTDRDDVAEINMKDGRKPGEAVPIKTELASLTQSTYPLAQLQNRPLPDGVNPVYLEDYLEAQCFPDVFGMEKEEFLNLPSWKKKKLKQEAGLF